MDYVPSASDREKVRWNIQDVETGLYILDDSTLDYVLIKNNGSIDRASLDAARMVLLRLSLNSTDSVTDVLSIKTSKQAEQYRLALQLYISNPLLNPLISNVGGWAGNISKTEMLNNNYNPDNYVSDLIIQQDINNPNKNPFTV